MALVLRQFVERATELGATVHLAAGADEATAQVVGIFRSVAARVAVLSRDLRSLELPIAGALAEAGAKLVEDSSPSAVAKTDLGVTGAALAVAETGSILVAGNDSLPRLATMLPLIHVAVVDARSLVPSLDDAAGYLRQIGQREAGGAVRYASLISGPSRTADIEKTLSTGVHGPRELHIVLIHSEPKEP